VKPSAPIWESCGQSARQRRAAELQGERRGRVWSATGVYRRVKVLAEFGFTFDLCIRHEQLRSVAELAKRVPQVTFVLDHFGKPDVRGKKTEPWAKDLKTLAALRMRCKFPVLRPKPIGGIGNPGS